MNYMISSEIQNIQNIFKKRAIKLKQHFVLKIAQMNLNLMNLKNELIKLMSFMKLEEKSKIKKNLILILFQMDVGLNL